MRVILDANPLAPSFLPPTGHPPRTHQPIWISPANPAAPPEVLGYRVRFSLAEPATLRLHVSADERYELWMDGQRQGRGPERSSKRAWFYDTYDLPLATGEHVLFARVWQLGALAPQAQISTAPGFLCVAEAPFEQAVSTGRAAWQVKRLDGYQFSLPDLSRHPTYYVVAPNQTTDAARFPWGVEMGAGDGWEAVVSRIEDGGAHVGIASPHPLLPATLPPQMSAPHAAGLVRLVAAADWGDVQCVFVPTGQNIASEQTAWQHLLDHGHPVVVPPHTRRQILLDLQEYTCAYPQFRASGGAGSRVTIGWAESLFNEPEGRSKGQRDQVEGRFFIALMHDTFLLDGSEGREYPGLAWRAGRFVQVLVATAEAPLRIEALRLEETRYPLEQESRFTTSDGRLDRVTPIMLRGLQMCAHETYMDCPYYEQLMYVGDTRLQALTTYALAHDDRLPRKALRMFERSRLPSGMTQARYPSRDPQVIAPFSLWWVAMVHDYAFWRDDRAFVRSLLAGVRGVLDGFLDLLDAHGLLGAPDGWNFADWATDWTNGVPPDATQNASGLLNWQLVYTLGLAAQLEAWAGEPELAQRYTRQRNHLAQQASAAFWDESRGLFADNLAHTRFSEHTQCLALLSGMVEASQVARVADGLFNNPALSRTTIYFSHYLFEASRLFGRAETIFTRLQLWFDLPEQGFTTTPEAPEPTRSDCHGWGAHPIFHAFATLLGIRPASPGFATVDIAPLLGPLEAMSGTLVHPRGQIAVELRQQNGRLEGSISLPEGVSGTLRHAGMSQPLVPGPQQVALA